MLRFVASIAVPLLLISLAGCEADGTSYDNRGGGGGGYPNYPDSGYRGNDRDDRDSRGDSIDDIPYRAQLVERGTGRISFRADRDGVIYVADRDSRRLLISRRVDPGDTVEVRPGDDRISVNGRRVYDANLESKHTHAIYFLSAGGRDGDRPPTQPPHTQPPPPRRDAGGSEGGGGGGTLPRTLPGNPGRTPPPHTPPNAPPPPATPSPDGGAAKPPAALPPELEGAERVALSRPGHGLTWTAKSAGTVLLYDATQRKVVFTAPIAAGAKVSVSGEKDEIRIGDKRNKFDVKNNNPYILYFKP